MRPEVLFPVFKPITELKGVGPRIAALIERVAGGLVVDLLWHLPTGLIDRRHAPAVADAQPGVIATLTVEVEKHLPARNKRMPYKVLCRDAGGQGTLSLVFFNARKDYLEKTLPPGETRVVSGKVEEFSGELQMTHPDHIGTLADKDAIMAVEPVYPLTQGLSLKVLGKAVAQAIDMAPELEEWLDPALVARESWTDWRAAVRAAHAPDGAAATEMEAPARRRLAYDELLANQLALALMRRSMKKLKGRPVTGDGSLRSQVAAALPYTLTGAQTRAIDEITADMASDGRMLRLLQGDVGSGKTLVAAMAMLEKQ